jgi:Holliday junction resolvase
MTTSVNGSLQARRLEQVAQQYRDRGYDVVLQPRRPELPAPISKLHPDLLARKDDDIVVVEVKTRESLRSKPLASELAKAVRAQPGWRFELIIANPEQHIFLPLGVRVLEEHEVAQRLAEAQALLDQGHLEAALLLAWSGAEAALRLTAEREGIALERQDPPFLLKQLALSGVLSREAYASLWNVMELRNAVAHGHRPPQLDPAVISQLAELAARLAQGAEA